MDSHEGLQCAVVHCNLGPLGLLAPNASSTLVLLKLHDLVNSRNKPALYETLEQLGTKRSVMAATLSPFLSHDLIPAGFRLQYLDSTVDVKQSFLS